jgi:hypothetical protein
VACHQGAWCIIEGIIATLPPSGHRAEPARMDAVYPDPFGREPEPDLSNVDVLIDEIKRQAALLTAVATGGGDFCDKRVCSGSTRIAAGG